MQHQALPGFREFYPEECAQRRHVLESWRRVAVRYGFEEYDGPPLEPLELYTSKSGDEIVGQLYAFTDKGDRKVALRPEMTPTLARMVGARARGLKKPIRWFSMPQLFRYERQQRGRLREHFQLNCDLIGEPGPAGDAEIIALAVDVMRDLGLRAKDVRVRISDRRLLNAMLDETGVAAAHHGLAYQLLDKLGRGEYEAIRQSLLAAGVAASIIERLEGVRELKDWTALEAAFPASFDSSAPLRAVFDALTAMGLGEFADLDLTIVRGLAYYTGPVFELFDAEFSLRAICGGGRYDTLLEAMGGDPMPALGFGMGDVVLTELLREKGLLPAGRAGLDVFVAAVTAEDVPEVLSVAHLLRDAGLMVEYPLSLSALGKQLKVADGRKARLAVVIGPDDRSRGQVLLKNFRTGDQRPVARPDLVAAVTAALTPATSSSVTT